VLNLALAVGRVNSRRVHMSAAVVVERKAGTEATCYICAREMREWEPMFATVVAGEPAGVCGWCMDADAEGVR
jgi:hypothetical protein